MAFAALAKGALGGGSLGEILAPLVGGSGSSANELKSLGKSIDDLASPTKLLASGFGAVNAPMEKLVGVFSAVEQGATAMGNSLAHFVQKANPAIVKQFTLAADDLTAVFGRMLIPAMQFATQFTRAFADVFAAIADPAQRMFAAFFDPLTDALPKLTDATAPLTRIVGRLFDAFARLAPSSQSLDTFIGLLENAFVGLEVILTPTLRGLEVFAIILGRLAENAMRGVGAIARLLGFDGLGRGGGGVAGGSVGMAAQNAQIGDVASFQNRAITSAFMMGAGARPPAERTASAAEKMLAELEKLPAKMWAFIVQLPGELWEFIRRLPPQIAAELAALLGRLPAPPGLPEIERRARAAAADPLVGGAASVVFGPAGAAAAAFFGR